MKKRASTALLSASFLAFGPTLHLGPHTHPAFHCNAFQCFAIHHFAMHCLCKKYLTPTAATRLLCISLQCISLQCILLHCTVHKKYSMLNSNQDRIHPAFHSNALQLGLAMRMRNMWIMRLFGICGICGCGLKISSTYSTYRGEKIVFLKGNKSSSHVLSGA